MSEFSVGDRVQVVYYDTPSDKEAAVILGQYGVVVEGLPEDDAEFIAVSMDRVIDRIKEWLFYPNEIERV